MSRTNARKCVFYLLFQMNFYPIEEFEQIKELFFQEMEQPITEEEKAFILQETEGTKEHLEKVDTFIAQRAKGWSIERISKVDLTILRLAIYEIYFSQTPVGVVINEAVELAKQFSTDQSPSFINGVLGKIAALPRE